MIKKKSFFKNEIEAKDWFVDWVEKLENLNKKTYENIEIETSLGKTQVYGQNTSSKELPALLIFPGFRTTSLVWDLDNGLADLTNKFRIYLIETNGQPNLSEGNSPSIKSLDYGHWGKEVLDQLGLDKVHIAGASFGGLVCMKISIVCPDRIEAAYLFNPGCFRFVSFGAKNMFYNLLPLLSPKRKNILKFLDQVIFSKPNHQLNKEREELLIDYLEYVLKNYKDKTEKPYYMGKQLDNVKVNTYLFLGSADILLPYKKSQARAQKHLNENLKDVYLFDAGHGIETLKEALNKVIQVNKEKVDSI